MNTADAAAMFKIFNIHLTISELSWGEGDDTPDRVLLAHGGADKSLTSSPQLQPGKPRKQLEAWAISLLRGMIEPF